tara:strand:- start:189 stop:1139 length:951 start_codon:yes stop_codon:yes gene_type:complete
MLKRLGFIGAGKMAQHHARAAVALGAEIFSVSTARGIGPNIEMMQEIANGGITYCTHNNLVYEDKRLDAVIVAAPWNVIPEMMPQLLECKLPMLIEKPVYLGTVDRAGHQEVPNKFVAYNRRCYDGVQLLRGRIAEGGVRSADVTISEILPSIIERHGEEIVPHLWEMNCAHTLDLLFYLFGDFEVEWTFASELSSFMHCEAMLMGFYNIPINLHIHENDPSPAGIRVRFDGGEVWVLSPLEVLRTYKGVTVSGPSTEDPIRHYSPQMTGEYFNAGQFKPGVYEQMEKFLYEDWDDLCSLDQAVEVHNLIHDLKEG